MDKLLIALSILVGAGMLILASPDGAAALLLTSALALVVIFFINKYVEEKTFLIQVFLGALLVRIGFGLIVHFFEFREFFGGDAVQYDRFGQRLAEIWFGQDNNSYDPDTLNMIDPNSSGWGMYYVVGFVYSIFGRNIFAAQSFCAVFGAATSPLGYLCAKKIFNNHRVAAISALAIAFFPSLVIWSSQLLKDGLIIFLLVLTMVLVLQLQEKFSFLALSLLIFSLFGIISLRFYIFFMVAVSIAGSFVVGLSSSFQSTVRSVVVIVILGLGLTYIGVLRNAGDSFEQYGNLERVQASRQALASTAESGFGADTDVGTTSGAISALPIGFLYLMLAPFPWEIINVRQLFSLPDILLWWASIPFLISGIWYSLKHRLRKSISISIFSLMLTLVYSVFQGNVGTAYRQRTQIQVFLFIFVAVGWSLIQERKENKKARRLEKQDEFRKKLQASS